MERLATRLKSGRRRKESLIRALFPRKFETPYIVSYGNELFFNGLLNAKLHEKILLKRKGSRRRLGGYGGQDGGRDGATRTARPPCPPFLCAFPVRLSLGGGGCPWRLCV